MGYMVSLDAMVQTAEETEVSESEEVQDSLHLAEEVQTFNAETKEAQDEFMTSLQSFHSEQEQLLQEAKAMLPKRCGKCECYVHSKKDKGCMSAEGTCFNCFTAEQQQRTLSAEGEIEASKYSLISTMDLSDYEEWLFDDDMGKRSLARIIAKATGQGFDHKPWQISIGAAAWSKDNYNSTSLEDTRYLVERVKINDLRNYIPESPDNITTVIDSIKRAEEIIGINTSSQSKGNHWPIIGGIAGISILIPYLLNRR